MKNTLLLLSAILLPVTASAQSNKADLEDAALPPISEADVGAGKHTSTSDFGLLNGLGIYLGPNLSSVSTTSLQRVPEASGRARMAFGVNADILLAGFFSFQPELAYVQRGFAETTSDRVTVGSSTKTSTSMDYLEVPLLLKIRPQFEGRLHPFVLAGPSLGVLLSRSVVVTETDTDGQSTVFSDVDREGGFSTVHFALNFGAGVDFELQKNLMMVLNMRYSAGLSNLENLIDVNGVTMRKIGASSVQLLAGVQFLL